MPSRSRSRRQTLRLGSALTLVLAGGRLRTANAKGQILPEGEAYAPWGLWNGCGANVVGRAIRGLEVGTGHVASTAFQISEAVLFLTRSLSSLN